MKYLTCAQNLYFQLHLRWKSEYHNLWIWICSATTTVSTLIPTKTLILTVTIAICRYSILICSCKLTFSQRLHGLYGLTGARVGDGAGSGATPSRRHTEVSEEARSSSAGSDTAAGRGTEGSGPHERHDRETAAEEQAVQTTSRGSRKPTLLCHLFIHPSFIILFYHDRLLLSVEFWLHVHRDYRFTSVCFRFCDS